MQGRRNPNWTPEEDAKVAVMKRLGMSNAVVGEWLGRTAEAVKRRLTWMRMSAEKRAYIGRTRTRNRGGHAPLVC